MIAIDIKFTREGLSIPGESGLFVNLAKSIANDYGFTCSAASPLWSSDILLKFRKSDEITTISYCNFLDDLESLARLHRYCSELTIEPSNETQPLKINP